MNTDEHGLKHSQITEQIIRVFFTVYNELGPGFLESVYVQSLAIAFSQAGLPIEREKPLTVRFRGELVGKFRADLIVGEVVLVEVKACSKLNSVHEAQTLNYLRATSLEVALLLNFGSRPQFRRLLFDNPRKICPARTLSPVEFASE
ncbi:MAG TPA: GxxExxY protein [Gemmatimonadales bacterium]|nr:GxxExxY protein [Gemmatimonadales bacterium]